MRQSARALTSVTVLAVLVAVSGWLVWPTQLGGHTAYVTTHGISMEPRFHTGDLAVLRPADRYDVGDVVAYRSHLLKTTVMHRIVAVESGRYTFKGDNNAWLDPEQPTAADLIGRLSLRVPQGGTWLGRLTSPTVLGLAAFALLASGGTAVQTRRRRRRGTMSRHAARPNRSAATLRQLPPQLRTVATASAALGVLALAVGAAAWSGPLTATTTSTKQAHNRSLTFSYTATVPRSPAYDGTVATSPDPVFRKLAHTVDVHLAYQGSPGTIAVTGELSTPSGWHATVPLAPSRAFTSSRYAGEVHLDLAALEARAHAAAAVIGLPADQISLQVVPEITSANAAPFRPALALALTPLQLKLAGGSSSLVVKDSTSTTAPSLAARQLGLLGHHLSVATARSLSLLGLLVSLIIGAVVLLVARRTAPTSEGAGIRQRYAPLLVAVHPMPTPAGRPVVDVTEFATLAKLAERYGLLVLHWSRSDVETFVVQDEGTTYRYRTGARPQDQPTGPDREPTTHPAATDADAERERIAPPCCPPVDGDEPSSPRSDRYDQTQ